MLHYSVKWSNREVLEKTGYEHLADVPFIMDGNQRYHRLGSEYLIDRCQGLWVPSANQRASSGSSLSLETNRNYAHWLANFLEWACRRGVDIFKCTYNEQVHGRYQNELVLGTWSRDGEGLAPKTINAYVDQACNFLSWMADKRKRPAFAIPTVTVLKRSRSSISSRSHRTREIHVRKGKVRVPKRHLRMPKDGELRSWLDAIERKRGIAARLICELVLMGALRRAEAVAFRVDTLPRDPADWHITNPNASEEHQLVLIRLQFGTKGAHGEKDHGDKVGPPGDISIPLKFAQRLHQYRENVRPEHLGMYVEQVRGAKPQQERRDDSVHMFLNSEGQNAGRRITYSQFYQYWRKSGCLPYRDWHPHLGRDWWACITLLADVKLHQHVAALGSRLPGALLIAAALDVIRLKIQPQLRHANVETCFIYLQWLYDELGVELPEQYQAFLDDTGEELSKKEFQVEI